MADTDNEDRTQERKFTWDKDDVEFERDPSLPPLLTPEQRAEFKRKLATIRHAHDGFEFKEEQHPRDNGGKFTKGGGFGKKSESWSPVSSADNYAEMGKILTASGISDESLKTLVEGDVALMNGGWVETKPGGSWQLDSYKDGKLASGNTWASLYNYLSEKIDAGIISPSPIDVNKGQEEKEDFEDDDDEEDSPIRKEVASWNPPDRPVDAIDDYKGVAYEEINHLLRYGLVKNDDNSVVANHIREIENWLNKASSKKEITVYRGVPKKVADSWSKFAKKGRFIQDEGFMSSSLSKRFADKWSGEKGITLKINVPVGSQIVAVAHEADNDSENEILVNRGSVVRITAWNPAKNIYEGVLEKKRAVKKEI